MVLTKIICFRYHPTLGKVIYSGSVIDVIKQICRLIKILIRKIGHLHRLNSFANNFSDSKADPFTLILCLSGNIKLTFGESQRETDFCLPVVWLPVTVTHLWYRKVNPYFCSVTFYITLRPHHIPACFMLLQHPTLRLVRAAVSTFISFSSVTTCVMSKYSEQF
jgi:hypothetical protein